jgi:6,7-dimethyl-8-ribityllumazine synthase
MMAKRIEGQQVAKKGARFAVVVSRTNSLVTERLLSGCMDGLVRHGADDKAVDVIWVPGSYELPFVVKAVCAKKKHTAVIALGCVIRGGTPHFDYIAAETAKGVAQASLETGVPVAFGVLTCDSLEQALERAGAKGGNKGWEAALSALEMADLMERL